MINQPACSIIHLMVLFLTKDPEQDLCLNYIVMFSDVLYTTRRIQNETFPSQETSGKH